MSMESRQSFRNMMLCVTLHQLVNPKLKHLHGIQFHLSFANWWYGLIKLKPQANPLTFRVLVDSAECKIYEITGETVIYSFHSITRNITRLLFSLVTY